MSFDDVLFSKGGFLDDGKDIGYRSFSLSRNKKMNCKPSSGRSQDNEMFFLAQSFWVICRNVSRTFMETPYWCTVLVHQYGRRKSTKHLEFTFSIKALSFRELAYVRINISSNTSNGYTADNQEERLFFKTFRWKIPNIFRGYFSRSVKETLVVSFNDGVFSKWGS